MKKLTILLAEIGLLAGCTNSPLIVTSIQKNDGERYYEGRYIVSINDDDLLFGTDTEYHVGDTIK